MQRFHADGILLTGSVLVVLLLVLLLLSAIGGWVPADSQDRRLHGTVSWCDGIDTACGGALMNVQWGRPLLTVEVTAVVWDVCRLPLGSLFVV